jgi:hypothetical protein
MKILFATLLLLAPAMAIAGDSNTCPLHAQHMAAAAQKHGDAVDERHDTMGFSHDVSKHTFRLTAGGGAIELRALDARDGETVRAIRTHLRKIARDFEKGDFSTPEFIHGGAPDGVAVMIERKGSIGYRFETLPDGALVIISSKDRDAIAAVHQFLRFQIDEHRTGDSGAVEPGR